MSLAPGARLGPYEIIAAIGAGGMGEVYRARDPRLGRDVAIKVLPVSFSADADRLRRFEQEARAAAALNHPNILAVFDIGTHESAPYVVSELLEGETLRERLSHGALPTRKAIDDAIQIAHGLAAAHEKGIVHRDLKPENIFITNDGRLKILDFGLAKLTETDQMLSGASNVPTTPHFETEPGMLLGTMGYMAPEQLRGLSVDHRADIFAFGVILYEMLAGHRAFQGATVVDTITAILKEDPQDLPIAERHIPPALTRIIDRCLEKSASARFKSADDLAFALECLSAQSDVATVVKTRSRWVSRERIAWTLVAALLAVFVASLFLGGIGHVRATGAAEPPEMRLQIATPVGSASTAFAISPDGRKLAFLTTNQLWLRLLDSETAQPLAGTNGLQLQSPPFWSPDSQSIGFFAAGQLKRIDIAGGVVRTLAPAPTSRGGSWNSEGTILFAPSATGPLYRVPAAGGNATEATHAQPPRQTGHRFPHFLPDGRHFLFFAVGTPENQGIYLGALDSTDVRRLLDANSAATFVPPNYLLFARQETLLAQRFDLDKLELAGAPEPVAAQVAVRPGGIASVALSSSAGLIAYRPGAGERQLVWFDRTGRQTGTLSAPDAAQPGQIRLSPDGGTVALHRTSGGNTDVWLIETARGVVRRFTTDPASEFNPIWSPDGSRVVFTSDRNGGLDDLYEKVVDGSASETVLLASPEFKDGTDWSSDGRFILYGAISPVTGVDLWALPLFGDRKPLAVARTAFTENWGRFSPDSRWIVYQSDETGRPEIYVQPFPGPGGKLQISTDGGAFPEWRRDGRELFYVSRDSRLMAVTVTLKGTKIVAGTPIPLFPMPSDSEYAVSADGQRFLVNMVAKEAPPITVLLNWAGLKK